MDRESLIPLIYEAGFISELWPRVLDQLVMATESAWGSIVTVQEGAMVADSMRFIGTERAQAAFAEYLKAPLPNRRANGGILAFHRFYTDFDIFTQDQMDVDPFYTRFMRPHGGGWFAATQIATLTGQIVAPNVERSHERGPFERRFVVLLNELRPHLARAALISARLSLQNAKSSTDALQRVGLAAAVLDSRARLSAANALFHTMIPKIIVDRPQRATFVDRSSDKLFETAVAGLSARGRTVAIQSIALAARDGRPPMVAHLVPITRAVHDIFSSSMAFLVVTPLVSREGPNADLLRALFDLTASEARVAREITQGYDIDTTAQTIGLSRETVRSYLKCVFAKTGTKRQSELVALLVNASLG